MNHTIHKRTNYGSALCGVFPHFPDTATSRSAHVNCQPCLARQKINRTAARARYEAVEDKFSPKETACPRR